MAKQKSLKINMILNTIRGLLSVIFPLITFPYISNVLGVDNVGKYNFANSIISYFVLIAGLGINLYAIREGASIRDNKDKLNKFANQIFSINMISTIVAYFLLFILTLIVPKFANYKILIYILSLEIIFKTIGIEWIYSIYEDYKYITIRSIIFQILSLLLMFGLVHTEKDLNIYTCIAVFSSVGSNILNFINSKKYCNLTITKEIDFKKHLKPIFILFATSVTATIYVNSDITILGFLTSDYNVGIYSVATKVYAIIKSLLASVIVVSVPRLSALIVKDDKNDFRETAEKIYKALITIIIPSVVGIIALRKEIILLISNETYMESTIVLALLSIAIFFALGAHFWGQAMLLPLKKEKKLLIITLISAITNITLNLVLIPIYKEKGAAITTVIAEMIVYFYGRYETKKCIRLNGEFSTLIKSIVGSIPIFIISIIIRNIVKNFILCTGMIISLSICWYIFAEMLLKNDVIEFYLKVICNKLKYKYKKVNSN